MVTPMNEKLVRKPRNVRINLDALHRAQVEALRERKTLGEWLEEAIEEKIQRAKRRLDTVPVKRIPSL
jgi:predicted HicB family RNase H-like nuclease